MRAAVIAGVVVVVASACKRDEETDRPMRVVNLTKKRQPQKPQPPCTLDGSYRFRFRSNDTDGWWLRLELRGDHAHLTASDPMDVVAQGQLPLEVDGCSATIRSHNDHSGDVTLSFTLDPTTNVVTGELARTKFEPGTVPVTGRRDVGPPKAPSCIHPGIFELSVAKTKWKLDGHPRVPGGCAEWADTSAKATVRVEPFGDELVIDEVHGDTHEQGFARGAVTKQTDCTYDVALALQDFSFAGTITFASDTLSGTAKTARYQFFENGDAGENLWSCTTYDAPLVGKRIAD